MVTDQQVLLLRRKIMEGKTQQASAAAAGMGARSARRWQRGPLPSEKKKGRSWRTHPDACVEVWDEEIVPLLRGDLRGKLEATVVLEWVDERHPGRFSASHLRTLQRRMRDWRAQNGPEREVYFEQEHPSGREGQMDFTHCGGLGVTIGGEPFEHMLFQFVLSHSVWPYAQVRFSETFSELVSGLQGAPWDLGAAPEVVADNLSAATHELLDSDDHAFTENYRAIQDHYGLKATLINPRNSPTSFDRGNIRALSQFIYGTSPTSTGIAMSFVFAPLRPIQRAGLWQSEI